MVLDYWRRHKALPRWLRVQWLAPITVLTAILGGILFSLPAGPLCDEGMILFMEGGCDFGPSNVFFHAKVSVLLVFTWALLFAARRRVSDVVAFVPHFVVAAYLAWAHRSGGRCDTYYAQPNGSFGQMVLEVAAFTLLGLFALRLMAGRPWPRLIGGAALWHGTYVVSFYAWLLAYDHWTWSHSIAVAGTLALFAVVMALAPNNSLQRTLPSARGIVGMLSL